MDLIYQEPEAAVHEPMYILGVEVLGDSRVVDHVSEKDCDELSLPLDSLPVVEDLLSQKLGRIGPRVGVVNGWRLRGAGKVKAALVTKPGLGQYGLMTVGTGFFQPRPALETEPSCVPVLEVTRRTLHGGTLQSRRVLILMLLDATQRYLKEAWPYCKGRCRSFLARSNRSKFRHYRD